MGHISEATVIFSGKVLQVKHHWKRGLKKSSALYIWFLNAPDDVCNALF